MSDPHDPTYVPRWRPLERHERRVVGVLAEKAKTTPENYPLTVNSLVNGCNQKSNRFPQMQLDEDQVSAALDNLRHAGAVAQVQGDGRVDKYRHLLYDWLGVDKAELAVMTELLLRAPDPWRAPRRAAHMEPIKDLGELLPIVDRLKQKRLVIYLTPAGRGAVVTHNLYQPQELDKVRAEHAGGAASPDDATYGEIVDPALRAMKAVRAVGGDLAADDPPAVDALRAEVAALKRELAEVREHADSLGADLRRELEDLKRQLGA